LNSWNFNLNIWIVEYLNSWRVQVFKLNTWIVEEFKFSSWILE
jgi:hypothetical protein